VPESILGLVMPLLLFNLLQWKFPVEECHPGCRIRSPYKGYSAHRDNGGRNGKGAIPCRPDTEFFEKTAIPCRFDAALH